MKNALYLGAGAQAKIATEIAEADTSLHQEPQAYFDVCPDDPLREAFTAPVVETLPSSPPDIIIPAIGSNGIRYHICNDALEKYSNKVLLRKIIHPTATVSPNAFIGHGVVIHPGAVIGPETEICTGVIVNNNATVSHHSRVENFAHVAPGATLCGRVTVGEKALVGAGATMLPGAEVKAGITVKAGSVSYEGAVTQGWRENDA